MKRRRLTLLCVCLAIAFDRPAAPLRADPPSAETLPPSASRVTPGESAGSDPALDGVAPKSKSILELTTDVQPPQGPIPASAAAKHLTALEPNELTDRTFQETLFFWEASNLSHRPLRFEQAYLERYGYHYGCAQPVVSGVQFFGDVLVLPAKCIVVPSRRSIYTLGTGRPGSYGTRQP